MGNDKKFSLKRIERLRVRLADYSRILGPAAGAALCSPRRGQKPVIFFNASTRINDLSLNAGFSLVTSWAVRLAGVPVVHFVCSAGMSRCVLGADPDRPDAAPPCKICVRQSRFQTVGARARFFSYHRDEALAAALDGLSVEQLSAFECRLPEPLSTVHCTLDTEHLPLGALVLPSMRWRLRLHNLQDDEATRFLFREYLLSAWNVAREFSRLLDETDPQAVVLFNGQFFPEAVARFLARRRGVRVVTHEVGLQPFSAYFTEGEATAYPIAIPETFELDEAQNARLDAYLENRFQGRFSMAGIQFWPEMKGLGEAFLKKAAGFRQVVPVFTNVIFDTSQPHSNVVFPDMFAWLDLALEAAKAHPETLFVLRAHPDEARPGKAARESVAGWVAKTGAAKLPNIVFVAADEFLSSYELIQRSKFVMIYNSTIGLEASIMGAPVLCAGKARFTQYPAVFFPESVPAYREMLEQFLRAAEVKPRPEHLRNARRFLYYQLFRTSLPFGEFLEPSGQRGYVRVRPGALSRLRPDRSPAVRAVLEGILHGGDFLLEEA
ncbi:MAG: capsule polysaccharide biosynthesis family protein [Anaerolineaceae bacterium]|nr:MAG: capsule polysaccharide biosynthesis family protein [Anaerolineaceae bacterium]